MSELENLCALAECTVARTGKCHLGSDPVERCPNYAPTGTSDEDALPEGEPAEKAVEPIEICSGDVMQVGDLARFGRAHAFRSVALVGEHRAGKTTLIAAIYEMFCKGPYAGWNFAGSRTLIGFAKRHHLALLNSNRTNPTVPRTSRSDPASFFHLALSRSPMTKPMHLVISDRSGEAYGDARIDTSLIKELPELMQAQRACFLLDAGRLGTKEQRAAYSRQFKQMINAFNDNGALVNTKFVEVLATKMDLPRAHADADEQARFLDDYELQVLEEFRSILPGSGFYRVCALPKADQSIGFLGLEDTVRRWTAPAALPDVAQPPIMDAVRQIDRLGAKWGARAA
jgi:hypothetical protein